MTYTYLLEIHYLKIMFCMQFAHLHEMHYLKSVFCKHLAHLISWNALFDEYIL